MLLLELRQQYFILYKITVSHFRNTFPNSVSSNTNRRNGYSRVFVHISEKVNSTVCCDRRWRPHSYTYVSRPQSNCQLKVFNSESVHRTITSKLRIALTSVGVTYTLRYIIFLGRWLESCREPNEIYRLALSCS